MVQFLLFVCGITDRVLTVHVWDVLLSAYIRLHFRSIPLGSYNYYNIRGNGETDLCVGFVYSSMVYALVFQSYIII